jgi:hypothetical protein
MLCLGAIEFHKNFVSLGLCELFKNFILLSAEFRELGLLHDALPETQVDEICLIVPLCLCEIKRLE